MSDADATWKDEYERRAKQAEGAPIPTIQHEFHGLNLAWLIRQNIKLVERIEQLEEAATTNKKK